MTIVDYSVDGLGMCINTGMVNQVKHVNMTKCLEPIYRPAFKGTGKGI